MRSLIDIGDLSVAELDALFSTAADIIANPDAYADACRRRKLKIRAVLQKGIDLMSVCAVKRRAQFFHKNLD